MMRWQDMELEVDETATKRTFCDCCNKVTTHVEGYLSFKGDYRSWYMVDFSEDEANHPPIIAIYVGDFSEGAPKESRWGAQTLWHSEGCELLDWEDTSITTFTPLKRQDILGSEFEPEFWALVDTVIMKDPRLEQVYA